MSKTESFVPETPVDQLPIGDPPDPGNQDTSMEEAQPSANYFAISSPSNATPPSGVEVPIQQHKPNNQLNRDTPIQPSFRDTLNGANGITNAPRVRENLLASKKMELHYHEQNPLLPKFFVSPELREILAEPWKKALVMKPLGRNVGFMTFEKKVKELW